MSTTKESVFTHIDESDLNHCRQVFEKYDVKNQGYIDYYDLKEGLHEVGIDFNHPNVFYKIISELKSTSPYITFKDFVKIYVRPGHFLSAYIYIYLYIFIYISNLN